MPELRTPQQVRDYLEQARVLHREYRLYPFEYGWVISPELTQQEQDRDDWVTLSILVLDSRTGQIWQLPSWPEEQGMAAYRKVVEQGATVPGHQIYPHRIRVHLRLIRDEPEQAEYEVAIESLESPKQHERVYPLTIDKQTLRGHPTDTWSAMATVWAAGNRTGQSWPETGMFEY